MKNDLFDDLFDDIEEDVKENKQAVPKAPSKGDDFDFKHLDFDGDEDELLDDTVDGKDGATLQDYGESVILAYIEKGRLIFITNGTEGRLEPCIQFLSGAFGSKLVKLPVGLNDVDEMRSDSEAFNRAYADYL